MNTPTNKKTIFSKKRLNKKMLGTLCAIGLVSGCAHTDLAKPSNMYYHAPAQAYNLFLGNAAIKGQPNLQESCSEYGSSLQIVDSSGDFFRIDVLNLLGQPNLISSDKKQSAQAIADYFQQLYQIPNSEVQPYAVKIEGKKQLYIPMNLQENQPATGDGAPQIDVLGMLVSKHENLLFSVQHVQRYYNEAQMLKKLKSLQHGLSIPGRFIQGLPDKLQDSDGQTMPETLGFININPTQASPEQVSEWRVKARC